MTFSLVLAALLCFTTWMSVVHTTHAPVQSNCCEGFTTSKVNSKCFQSYTIQTDAACPVKAVVFHGKKGVRICADPNGKYAKRVIRKLDEQKKKQKALQEMGQNEEVSTSNITPAVSLPLQTTPQKIDGKGSHQKGERMCV